MVTQKRRSEVQVRPAGALTVLDELEHLIATVKDPRKLANAERKLEKLQRLAHEEKANEDIHRRVVNARVRAMRIIGQTPDLRKLKGGATASRGDVVTWEAIGYGGKKADISRALADWKPKGVVDEWLAENSEKKSVATAVKLSRVSTRPPHKERTVKFRGKKGTANVILCDPPWRYEFTGTESRAIENQYPTMTDEQLANVSVETLAAPDAVMFMWATSPKLIEAINLLADWDFEYKTCAVWDKGKMGMGYYFRQQHELLLVGTKGELPAPAPATRPSSVFRVKRGKHSEKPAAVYEAIEAMYPDLPKLEMFPRTEREGWMAWGNEA